MLEYSDSQKTLLDVPLTQNIFIQGIAGTGKTTAAAARLVQMISSGVPAEQILVVAPQRTLLSPYQKAVVSTSFLSPGMFTGVTMGGLARRMVELFWPLIASEAGFQKPDMPPVFLTLETTQYYISQIVTPLLEQGFFNSVTIDRNRLFSQLIDNVNKAALGCFSYTEIGERLKSAWTGDRAQFRIFDDAQFVADEFRKYCFMHNLLDFSLQLDVFKQYLWSSPICQQYLHNTYRHLIVENIDEDTPYAHIILGDWLPYTESSLLIYDDNGGFRRLLGANTRTAITLKDLCPKHLYFSDSFTMQPEMAWFESALVVKKNDTEPASDIGYQLSDTLEFEYTRFFPEMLDWTAATISDLISNHQVQANQIAVLSPFLSDALRFSLSQALHRYGIPTRSLRPSRSLVEEPVTKCLINLTILAHPVWHGQSSTELINSFDLAYTMIQAIDGCDLVRAQLIANHLLRTIDGVPTLLSFDDLQGQIQSRITFQVGQKYEYIRLWINQYTLQPPQELDHFLSLLFGEVLSQPGFGFYQNYSAGEITANLIESVYKFRKVVLEEGEQHSLSYITTLKSGVLAAQYLRSWVETTEQAVLIAPAYTFLTANNPVDYQFWLDVGSRSWAERIYQPVTHPYVLSQDWEIGRLWTDEDETRFSLDALQCLVSGLARRCRKKLFLGLADLGEQGYEQRGTLMQVFQNILRNLANND